MSICSLIQLLMASRISFSRQVYEQLCRLGLPAWDRHNWQSRIRTYARAHPDYASLEEWTRSETADLVYEDAEGILTRKLADWGYLEYQEWRDARPKYYLEVKTTTGPCETPFYASGKQYRLVSCTEMQGHGKGNLLIL